MSGETSAVHKRNLESSILFMQQEHATTLKALHEEIAILQKRCTDLTFQLTMHGLTIDEPGTVDSQMQQVQQDLEMSRKKIASLEEQMVERDKRVERLEADAKIQRKKFLEESRGHSQLTNSLKAELEAKSNNIAYLTTELHRLKQKSRMDNQASNSSNPNAATAAGSNPHQPPYLHPDSVQQKTQTHHHYVPTPPQRERSTLGPGSSASRMRHSGHKKQSPSSHSRPVVGMHPRSADSLPVRQPQPPSTHALRLSSGNRSSGSESPDITPFIQPPSKEEDLHMDVKQPLPPIASGGSINKSGPTVVGATPVLVHQVISSTSQKKSKPSGQTEASIVTLALGNAAATTDNAWSLAQEQRGSEYN